MSILTEKIIKNLDEKFELREGFIFKENSSYWYEELPTLLKGIQMMKKAADKYMTAVKKAKAAGEEIDNPTLEFQIEVDPTIKSVINKNKRGFSIMRFILRDADGALPKLLNNWVITQFELKTKIEL